MQPRECRRGCPQHSGILGARSRRHSRTLVPRFRFRSALGTTPPGAEPLSPGPQPLPPRAPQPQRPVLTPHPVHVGRHGRSRRLLRPHKGDPEASGSRAQLEAKPRARGWRFTEVSVGPTQPAPPPPQPSRFISARAVAAAATASHPGRRGRRRSPRLLPERVRLQTSRSLALESPTLSKPQQTLGSVGGGDCWPCPPRGSPPSGTPSADPENKARRSAQVGERDPTDRPLPEAVRLPPANRGPALGYFRSSSAPPPMPGGIGLNSSLPKALPLRLRPGEKRACALRWVICKRLCLSFAWSPLPHPFRALFFHPHPQRAPKAPSRAPQKDWEATLLLVYCPSAGSGSQGPGWGCPAQPAGLYSVCRGAARPLQGNARSGMSPS